MHSHERLLICHVMFQILSVICIQSFIIYVALVINYFIT